jgi:uncharacterized membrane protein
MDITYLIIGIIAVCWGSVTIYYAKSESEDVPTIIKPFFDCSIKNKKLQEILYLFVGFVAVIYGMLFILNSIIGRNLLIP